MERRANSRRDLAALIYSTKEDGFTKDELICSYKHRFRRFPQLGPNETVSSYLSGLVDFGVLQKNDGLYRFPISAGGHAELNTESRARGTRVARSK